MTTSTTRNRIQQFLVPPVLADDPDQTRAAGLLNTLLAGWFVVLMIILVAVWLFGANKAGATFVVGIILLGMLISKVLLQQKRVHTGSFVFIFSLWIPFTIVYALSDERALIIVFFAPLIVIAGLLIGPGASIAFTVASSLAALGIRLASLLGLSLPVLFPTPPMGNVILFIMGLVFLTIPLRLALRDLTRSLAQARTLFADANRQREQLAVLVDERTRDLTRSTNYVHATTAVASEAALMRTDLSQLLDRVAHVIGQSFGFYHTGLFLIDPRREWVELRAASSEGGQHLVARGLRLRLAEGMVGDVARQGRHRLAQDVQRDAAFVPHADLPDTRAELALPLRVRGETVGVLDVQSAQPDAFSDQDVIVLQALADQVAIVINNAQLLRQAEESAEAQRRAFRQISQEEWRALISAQRGLGFVSDQAGVATTENPWEPYIKAAAQTGRVVSGEQGASNGTLAMPIKVRDQVVGVIDGLKPQGAAWTQEEIDLLQTMTEQLGVALESARLYQDTQRRAAQEKLVGEVTARMRETLDMETVLRTAAEELRQALGVPELNIRLASPDKEASA